jgi:hypothetical protein
MMSGRWFNMAEKQKPRKESPECICLRLFPMTI